MRARYHSFDMPEVFGKIVKNHAKNRENTVMLTGSSEVFYLSHRWQADLALRGFDVHIVDCAIRFNPFLITEEALRNEVSPEYLLAKIGIRRAFTPYQILDSAVEAFRKGGINPAYFFLAPCKQFFDGDVAKDEAAFLLEKLIHIFRSFSSKNIPLVVVEKDNYSNALFSSIYPKLENMAGVVWRLEKSNRKVKKTPNYSLLRKGARR